jgi:hypothetical protein
MRIALNWFRADDSCLRANKLSESVQQLGYGLDGPSFESQRGGKKASLFSKTVQTDSGAHPTSYSMGTGVISLW